jgi:hypothetical protein
VKDKDRTGDLGSTASPVFAQPNAPMVESAADVRGTIQLAMNAAEFASIVEGRAVAGTKPRYFQH